MAKQTIGEVEWGLPGNNKGGNTGGKSNDFLQLKEGSNKVRVVSNPYQYYVHFVADVTGKKRKVNCALENCPVCKRGTDDSRATIKWAVKVIDRTDQLIKLCEIGTQIRNSIKELANDEDFGQPVSGYDLNIKRGPKGANPLYTVLGLTKSALTAKETAAIKEFDNRVDMAKIFAPLSPNQILEKLGMKESADTEFPPKEAAAEKDIDFSFDDN